jgi:hypothetical protein
MDSSGFIDDRNPPFSLIPLQLCNSHASQSAREMRDIKKRLVRKSSWSFSLLFLTKPSVCNSQETLKSFPITLFTLFSGLIEILVSRLVIPARSALKESYKIQHACGAFLFNSNMKKSRALFTGSLSK